MVLGESNEERLLARALESVGSVADEIVVVDTGSTDRTVEIARAHGAQVFFEPWEDDWAKARNAVLAHAQCEWVLMLDADQTLDPASRGEVKRLIQSDDLVGFLLLERSYMDEEGLTFLDNRAMRLFRNHPDIRYAGRIHEQLVTIGAAEDFRRVPCNVLLHHDGYRPGVGNARDRAERDLPVLEELVHDEPEDGFHWYNLGVTLRVLERPADAEHALRRCRNLIAAAAEGPPFFAVNAHVALALARLDQNRPGSAIEACQAALHILGSKHDSKHPRGNIWLQLQRLAGDCLSFKHEIK